MLIPEKFYNHVYKGDKDMIFKVIRFLVAIIMFAGGVLKYFNPAPFLRLLTEMHFNVHIAHIILTLIILSEFILSVLLIFYKKIGIVYTFFYMSFITLLLVILWLSGINTDCGCFGGFIQSQIGPVKILQNMALIAMLGVCWKNTTDVKIDHTRSFVK